MHSVALSSFQRSPHSLASEQLLSPSLKPATLGWFLTLPTLWLSFVCLSLPFSRTCDYTSPPKSFRITSPSQCHLATICSTDDSSLPCYPMWSQGPGIKMWLSLRAIILPLTGPPGSDPICFSTSFPWFIFIFLVFQPSKNVCPPPEMPFIPINMTEDLCSSIPGK